LITFILLLSLSGAPPLQDSHLTEAPSGANALADFESQELVLDPDLASPPEVVVVGESGEFSHDYDTDGEDGRAFLVWNHTAGTQLDFPGTPVHEFIDCNDFIYLLQPLFWESNSSPYKVKVIMEYGLDATGTFKTDESGWDKFRVFACLITQHYWIPISWWIPSINGTPQSFLINLGKSSIDSAWSDLEYPLNDIRLAIGFTPSHRCIESSTGSEPWSNYTGVVTMTVEGIRVEALEGRPASVEEIEPIHVGYTSRNGDEFFVDVEDAGDGTVYSLSVKSSSASDGTTLTRWNERADVLWASKTNSSRGFYGGAIDVYGGNVYAVGCLYKPSTGNWSPTLLRWSSNGVLTLAKDLSLELDGVYDLRIANDGSIYLTGYRYHGYFWESSFWITEHLIRIDHEGAVIWEVSLGTNPHAPTSLEVFEEGDIYALSTYSFTKWDQDANLLWNKTGWFFDLGLSPNGSICTVEATYGEWYYSYFVPHMYLVKRDSDGAVLWNHSLDIHYTETWSEPIWPQSMEIATDGSLYMFFGIPREEQRLRLAKYNSSGIQLWNKSLAPLSNERAYPPGWKMVLGRNGLIHIMGSHYDIESEDISLRMFVYFDSDYPVDPFNLPEIGLAIAFSVIAVLVVGDVVRRRRGLRFRT
jgi:hypothetical protein